MVVCVGGLCGELGGIVWGLCEGTLWGSWWVLFGESCVGGWVGLYAVKLCGGCGGTVQGSWGKVCAGSCVGGAAWELWEGGGGTV